MRLVIPDSSLSLSFTNGQVSKFFTLISSDTGWNAIFSEEGEDSSSKPVFKTNGSWLETLKNCDKFFKSLTEDGWSLEEDGLTMPLFVTEGSSDKEYHASLKASPSGWSTICMYGRRGSTLKPAEKAKNTDLFTAWKAFRSVVSEKLSDGYQLYVVGAQYQVPSSHSVYKDALVMLPIDAKDVQALIDDDSYFMEEKFDGERRPLLKLNQDSYVGTNKEGYQVSLNLVIEQALKLLGAKSFKLDSEDLGSRVAVFDIMEWDGQDMRQMGALARKEFVDKLLNSVDSKVFIPVRHETTTAGKQAFWNELISRNAEGAVFKKKDSTYISGKSLSGAHQKAKLYAEATVVVIATNQKSSVQIGVVDSSGQIVPVGNVTIPVGQGIPQPGQIIETRYLYAYKGGSLYQPSYKGPRPDQKLENCAQDKLKYKAEYDYSDI